jgi:lipoate-protein ligase A
MNLSVVAKNARKTPTAKWRLLPLRIDNAFTAMAIDEALLRLNAEGRSPNTLRFWRWFPSAVSLGYFQDADLEVNFEATRLKGIDVVRRITGGGAVFHDFEGELTYSIVCGQKDIPDDIVESYRLICGGLVHGFERLGVNAEFRPVNDIQVNGKKISGSAQTRRWGSVLQHGTVLISPDLRMMFEMLKISREKISDKSISSLFERMTTIEREIGRKPAIEEVREAIIAGFEDTLGIEFYEGELTAEELELAAGLRQKYSSEEWLRRPR